MDQHEKLRVAAAVFDKKRGDRVGVYAISTYCEDTPGSAKIKDLMKYP